MDNLKPCPLPACGGACKIEKGYEGVLTIVCQKCGTRSPEFYPVGEYGEQIRALWNDRPVDRGGFFHFLALLDGLEIRNPALWLSQPPQLIQAVGAAIVSQAKEVAAMKRQAEEAAAQLETIRARYAPKPIHHCDDPHCQTCGHLLED